MGEVIRVSFGKPPSDGGKLRIRRRRKVLFAQEPVDDLVMLHADTAPSEYVAPDGDCA
ncbi:MULTISPECIES: hypothetical protein [unclassified Bradyrhizobium]